MRTTFRIFAAAAAAALGILTSCQEQVLDAPAADGIAGKELVPVTLTASFFQTKVDYTETAAMNLKPVWVANDKVIGFDEDNTNYEFTVESVAADGNATITGLAPANCTLHLVYLGSATPANIEETSLPYEFSYNGQTGNNIIPAVMLADGDVIFGAGEFHFRNAGAVIGIDAVKGVPSGATINTITVYGDNLSAATVALDGDGRLALTAGGGTDESISTAALSGITVTDANGTLSSPVFIAVPAGANIKKVSTAIQAREPEEMKIPSTAAEKEGIDYVEIEALYDGETLSTKKWAKWNVGVSVNSEHPEKDYGWYFAWGGTEGYVPTEISGESCKWVSASGVDTYSYTLPSARTAVASDYLYVKSQSFTTAGHRFNNSNAPFNNGSSPLDETYFKAHISEWLDGNFEDGYTLKPDYDAARANWNESWRMPTSAEFVAMMDATYWAWDATDKGYYVYAPNPASDAGKRNSSGTGTSYSKSNALLFFPAAGAGSGRKLREEGISGHYWSIDLFGWRHAYYNYDSAGFLCINSNIASAYNVDIRSYGHSVRPIADPMPNLAGASNQDYNGSAL